MDKLMDFLQKEVPNNADELIYSINNTLECIERTRATVMSRMNKLVQNGRHKDAREFFDVDEQLSNAENFLKEFGNNIFQETLQNHQNTNYTTITSSEKSDFDFYKPNEAEPYNLDADFSKKKPVSFLFEGKNMMYEIGIDY